MDEMDEVFRNLGTGSPPPLPSNSEVEEPKDETHNVRNELREIAAKVTGKESKKKQATVSRIFHNSP